MHTVNVCARAAAEVRIDDVTRDETAAPNTMFRLGASGGYPRASAAHVSSGIGGWILLCSMYAGSPETAQANLCRAARRPPDRSSQVRAFFTLSGVAGFEPTTSSSRTTPPGVLMTLGTLARVSFPSSAALGGLARAGVAKIYCGLPAD